MLWKNIMTGLKNPRAAEILAEMLLAWKKKQQLPNTNIAIKRKTSTCDKISQILRRSNKNSNKKSIKEPYRHVLDV